MKSNRRNRLLLGLALGLCLTAGRLRGAELTGTFTLPSEVRWGTSVLAPGEYTLHLENANQYSVIYIRRGTKNVAMVLPVNGAMKRLSNEGSEIQIVGSYVRSLHLAPLGMTYYYAAPPEEERRLKLRHPRPPGVSVAVNTK